LAKIHPKKIEKQKNGVTIHTLENDTKIYDYSKIKFVNYQFSFGHTNEKIIDKLHEKINEVLTWAKNNNIIMDWESNNKPVEQKVESNEEEKELETIKPKQVIRKENTSKKRKTRKK